MESSRVAAMSASALCSRAVPASDENRVKLGDIFVLPTLAALVALAAQKYLLAGLDSHHWGSILH